MGGVVEKIKKIKITGTETHPGLIWLGRVGSWSLLALATSTSFPSPPGLLIGSTVRFSILWRVVEKGEGCGGCGVPVWS
jgi:hypothetical protein